MINISPSICVFCSTFCLDFFPLQADGEQQVDRGKIKLASEAYELCAHAYPEMDDLAIMRAELEAILMST